MNEIDIPINVELGEHGLYYGTSPAMKGLLVTGDSVKQVMERVPSAIAEMRAAVEISALRSKLEEAKEIISSFYDDVSADGRMHYPHDLTTRARTFLIARQAWLECPLDGDHWEATVQAVRSKVIEEAIEDIKALAANTQQLKMHMGEMEAQELRTLQSALYNLVPHKLTALKDKAELRSICHADTEKADQSVSREGALQTSYEQAASRLYELTEVDWDVSLTNSITEPVCCHVDITPEGFPDMNADLPHVRGFIGAYDANKSILMACEHLLSQIEEPMGDEVSQPGDGLHDTNNREAE